MNDASSSARQTGAALITSLILLLVLTIIGVTALRTATLEERMAANAALQMRAFQAADSAIDAFLSGLIASYTQDNDSSTLGAIAAGTATAASIGLDDATITATVQPAYLGSGPGIGHSIGVGAEGIASHRFEFIGSSEIKKDGQLIARSAVAAGASVLGPSD